MTNQEKISKIKQIFEFQGYRIISESIRDEYRSGNLELTLYLQPRFDFGSTNRITRKIRNELNLNDSPRLMMYPTDTIGDPIVIDLFAF